MGIFLILIYSLYATLYSGEEKEESRADRIEIKADGSSRVIGINGGTVNNTYHTYHMYPNSTHTSVLQTEVSCIDAPERFSTPPNWRFDAAAVEQYIGVEVHSWDLSSVQQYIDKILAQNVPSGGAKGFQNKLISLLKRNDPEITNLIREKSIEISDEIGTSNAYIKAFLKGKTYKYLTDEE